MDVKKALLVKCLIVLLRITACLSHKNKRKPQISKRKRSECMRINLPYVEGTNKKLQRILKSHKIRPTFYSESTLRKLLCKPKDRVVTQIIKTISFMKLTVVTAKQSSSVNLNGL